MAIAKIKMPGPSIADVTKAQIANGSPLLRRDKESKNFVSQLKFPNASARSVGFFFPGFLGL